MYDWYSKSSKCYAYLEDVLDHYSEENKDISEEHLSATLRGCRWFTRGWTLQELLAPSNVIFFSRSWKTLGSKHTLAELISDITGISTTHLYPNHGNMSISQPSIAVRMSWVSKRDTTRVEDLAYCMLGIFEINMPLLYGEGIQSFVRLQEEIIKKNHDQTIFCWEWDPSVVPVDWGNILAPSPSLFTSATKIFRPYVNDFNDSFEATPYTLTNLGLSIKLPFIHTTNPYYVCAVLDVTAGTNNNEKICIPLIRKGRPCRIPFPACPFSLDTALASEAKNIYVRSQNRYPELRLLVPYTTPKFTDGFLLVCTLETAQYTDLVWSYSGEGFDDIDHFGEFLSHQGIFGFRRQKNEPFLASILKFSTKFEIGDFLILLAIRYRGTQRRYLCQVLPPKYYKESKDSAVLRSILQNARRLSERTDSDISFSSFNGVTALIGKTIGYTFDKMGKQDQTCKALHIVCADEFRTLLLRQGNSSPITFDL
jgi:hypothetical protein